MGEALSAAASGNVETDGDSEPTGATGGVAKVFEVAGADPAGGVAIRGNSGSVPRERSGSVTPGGRCGTRMVPGGKAVAGFFAVSLIAGRIGARGFPGAESVPCRSLPIKERIRYER